MDTPASVEDVILNDGGSAQVALGRSRAIGTFILTW
jgi:hypothetical protein